MRVGIILPAFFELNTQALAPAILAAIARSDGHEVTVIDFNRLILAQIEADFPWFQRKHWDERCYHHPGQAIFSRLLFGTQSTVIEDIVDAYGGPPFAERTAPYKLAAQQVADRLADCDVVGITLNPFTLLCGSYLATLIRKTNPDAFIVAGGNLCSTPDLAGRLLDCFPVFDAVAVGEGEDTWRELLATLPDQPTVRGLLLARDRSSFTRRGLLTPEELDCLPDPDFSWLTPDQRISHTLPVLSARGCGWGKCRFCSDRIFWPGHRARSPEAVVNEMVAVADSCANHRFAFLDLAFNVPEERALEICYLLQQAPVDFELWAQLRAVPFSPELAIAMKAAGFRRVQFGLEALSDPLLAEMRKGTTSVDNVAAVRTAIAAGLEVTSNLIAGHPGETISDLTHTLHVTTRFEHLFNATTILGLYSYMIRYGTPDMPDRTSPELQPTFPIDLFPLQIQKRLPILEWESAVSSANSPDKTLWSLIRQATSRPCPEVKLSGIDCGDRTVIYGHQRGPIVLRGAMRSLVKQSAAVDLSELAADAVRELERLGLVYQDGNKVVSVVLPWRNSI